MRAFFTCGHDKKMSKIKYFPLASQKKFLIQIYNVKMAAPAMSEHNPDLASQCMDFCQALTSKGQTFSFTLNVGSFLISLATRGDGSLTRSKKKKSLSTLRRNARRRAEFLNKKPEPSTERRSSEEETSPEKEAEKRSKKFSIVINVTINSNLKMAWRYTLEFAVILERKKFCTNVIQYFSVKIWVITNSKSAANISPGDFIEWEPEVYFCQFLHLFYPSVPLNQYIAIVQWYE